MRSCLSGRGTDEVALDGIELVASLSESLFDHLPVSCASGFELLKGNAQHAFEGEERALRRGYDAFQCCRDAGLHSA